MLEMEKEGVSVVEQTFICLVTAWMENGVGGLEAKVRRLCRSRANIQLVSALPQDQAATPTVNVVG